MTGVEKNRFSPRLHTRIHSIRINDVQSQLNNLSLLMLSFYESCLDAGIKFNLTNNQKAHIEKAKKFREVEERSIYIKDKDKEKFDDDTIF